jgi:hypothetical protein
MSEEFLPPGVRYVAEAYELLADNCMAGLTGAEWKALTYIGRRLIGFRKSEDAISLSQFSRGIRRRRDGEQLDNGTGLTRETVVLAVNGLVDKGLIRVRRGGPSSAERFAINWRAVVDHSQKPTSRKIRPGVVGKSDQGWSENPTRGSRKIRLKSITCKHPNIRQINRQYYNSQDREQRDATAGSGGVSPDEIKRLCDSYLYPKHLYPDGSPDEMPDRIAQKALAAVNGATFEQVQEFFRRKFNEAGGRYGPGGANGPRGWPWFPRVLRNEFQPKQPAPLPPGYRLSDKRMADGGARTSR